MYYIGGATEYYGKVEGTSRQTVLLSTDLKSWHFLEDKAFRCKLCSLVSVKTPVILLKAEADPLQPEWDFREVCRGSSLRALWMCVQEMEGHRLQF